MRAGLDEAMQRFVPDAIAFGDLFLEDIRAYRESRMAQTGLDVLFPIWGTPTDQLALTMISGGLQAAVTCLDPARMPQSLAGAAFDLDFLAKLPATVDPCGENGEFHSFAWSGPMFKWPIRVAVGETVIREGFVYTDLTAVVA